MTRTKLMTRAMTRAMLMMGKWKRLHERECAPACMCDKQAVQDLKGSLIARYGNCCSRIY